MSKNKLLAECNRGILLFWHSREESYADLEIRILRLCAYPNSSLKSDL